jgi:hypothetical protein
MSSATASANGSPRTGWEPLFDSIHGQGLAAEMVRFPLSIRTRGCFSFGGCGRGWYGRTGGLGDEHAWAGFRRMA